MTAPVPPGAGTAGAGPTAADPAGADPTGADPAPVVARGLAAGRGGRTVWRDATFRFEAGERVAVLGPNGAGKSTLLRLLLGLDAPVAGDLRVFGSRPTHGDRRIGYFPQTRSFGDAAALRGLDLVRLGVDGARWGVPLPTARRRAERQMVDEAIQAVGAETYATRRIGEMSGGERQRLLLAQALVGWPSLLLLDEPLAGLDLRHQAAMVDLVAQVALERGITVVLVAHDLNPLRRMVDRVCYVAGGGILLGPPEEVVTGPVLSRLYGAPVEVLVDSRGRRFVVGLEEEVAHPHDHAGTGTTGAAGTPDIPGAPGTHHATDTGGEGSR